MPKDTLKNLNKARNKISRGQTSEEKFKALSHAFELFTVEAKRLEAAYSELNNQFQKVHKELTESNFKLNNKIFEFHIMMNYLTSILNNMAQGILFVSLKGIITTCNPLAAKMLRCNPEEVLYNFFWDVFSDRLLGFSMKEVLKASKTPERKVITLGQYNGTSKELEIVTTFVTGNSELSPETDFDFNKGLIILIRDITEIHRLQLIANRNNRMKELGEMAATLAHEIRNPLGGIKGFAYLLVRDLQNQPELQRMANYIVEGTDNLNRFVTDVLNYSRPIQIRTETTDLVSLIQEIKAHVLIDKNLNANTTIDFDSQVEELTLQIDPQLFKSVMLNLIANAIQSMPNGGRILLTLEKKESEAIIKVIDKGVGMSKEHLEKLFSPFFTTKPEGHGFGLMEVQRIIQAHQGVIEVDSELGKGSSFILKIPLISPEAHYVD